MKHNIGTKVKVVKFLDNTAETSCLNKTGTVNNYDDDSEDDPLHEVLFEDGSKQDFWYEELTIIFSDNYKVGKRATAKK